MAQYIFEYSITDTAGTRMVDGGMEHVTGTVADVEARMAEMDAEHHGNVGFGDVYEVVKKIYNIRYPWQS